MSFVYYSLTWLNPSLSACVNYVRAYVVIAMSVYCNYRSHAYTGREKGQATLDYVYYSYMHALISHADMYNISILRVTERIHLCSGHLVSSCGR